MKRMRIMGLCLVAVLASSAIMAASASAEAPEYGRCIATPGGKYATAACTTEKAGTNKFEWFAAFGSAKPLVKTKYKSKAVASSKIQLEGTGEKLGVKTVVSCTGQESEGTIIGNKEATAEKVVFTGCESSKVGCSTTGAAAGEIQVKDLIGTLGVEKRSWNKTTKKEEPSKNLLANEFTPKVGGVFVEFNCATALKVIVEGHVLNPIKTNSMTLSAAVKFSAPGGNQKPEHFSTGISEVAGKVVETFGPELSLEAAFVKPGLSPEFEESGQTLTTTQTNEEKVEANSVA
jgi:hypothetical protein